jgi:hypothetical protein
LAADMAAGRDADGTYARASAYARTPVANARADLLQQFGDHRTTQYAATLDSGIAVTGSGIGIAGRDMNDTALIVSLRGSDAGQIFDVLVDEVARGTIVGGQQLVLFFEPYEMYDVRLRPRGAGIASFDTAPRVVTLYPGNVSRIEWNITPLFILFGRAVDADGTPIREADITGSHGIGRTDGEGYFQIETNSNDELRLTRAGGRGCTMTIGPAKAVQGLVSAGDLQCR